MSLNELEQQIETRMKQAGVAIPTITAFLGAVRQVQAGASGLITEDSIEPIPALPRLDDLPADSGGSASLLSQLAVVKLNGGLGTGMGLDRAKSLLVVKEGANFLDFIARQILHLRKMTCRSEPGFYLMNSFSTREDSLAHLKQYADLPVAGEIDFMQSQVPKLEAATLRPVSWPEDPLMEWCPPGHGDIYPSMLGCGLLQRLLDRGVRYLFVSNSDNLGATVDFRLLRYFAESGLAFLMEVAQRTGADRKGGHLARRKSDGRLLLRESAQTRKEDEAAFQNIDRHCFFNTNNLWIRLDSLAEALKQHGGWIPLPLIRNAKTVDPRNSKSTPVLQLESAMGAAIETFDRSGAIVVSRERFAPVKTTTDLLSLRSDAYQVTADHRIVLDPRRNGNPPVVELDGAYFKILADFEKHLAGGVPSMIACDQLKVTGPVLFNDQVRCEGRVEFINPGGTAVMIPPGTYRDQTVRLG